MCAATASMSAFLATPTPPQAIDETPAWQAMKYETFGQDMKNPFV
jgi:hypothetical protein